MVRRFSWLLLALICGCEMLAPREDDRAVAHFPYVGQGHAVAVAVGRTCVLVDAGPVPDSVSPMWLAKLPCDSFAAVLITHWDLDHRGGLETLLSRFPVGVILHGRLPEQDSVRTRRESFCRRASGGCRSVRTGQALIALPGVSWTVLAAGADTSPEGNATSVVSRFEDASGSLLVAGDLDSSGEQALVAAAPGPLRSDLLLLSHHGSAGSNSLSWLGAVRPQLAVVQAGKDNRYGHPAAAVQQRLWSLRVPFWNTAELGGVRVRLDGSERMTL